MESSATNAATGSLPDDAVSMGWPVKSLAEIEAELCVAGGRFELETVSIRGRDYRCWKNQHRNLVELAKAAGEAHGDRDFIVYENERVTYAGWLKAVTRLAAHLVSLGVEKGDRVALAMRNYPEWPVAFFAGLATGAIVVPLNAWWTGKELRDGLLDSGAKVFVCDDARLERLTCFLEALPELAQIIVTRSEPAKRAAVTNLEDIIGVTSRYQALPDVALPNVTIDADDDATILYTSGTTGAPKGALATHRSNLSYVLGAAYAAERAARRRGQVASPSAPMVLMSAVPLFHVTGLNACLLPVIDAGGTFVMMRKWDAGEALALIERERVTVSGGVPTIAWDLIEHPDRECRDLTSLTTLFYGGASSAPELADRIRTDLHAAPANGWGMTETCGVGARHGDEDYLHRPSSCGPANPGTEFQIVDPVTHARLEEGKVGELWVRGAHVIKGYWKNPPATGAAIVDGWLRTGDLARLDDEGFCYIVGRAKEVIIRGGENIYPIEIENALFEHPAIDDVAVVGIPHRTLGEEPAAAVHLTPGTNVRESELKAWVGDRLAAYKVPILIEFFGSKLPRNASGKMLKSTIRDLLAAPDTEIDGKIHG